MNIRAFFYAQFLKIYNYLPTFVPLGGALLLQAENIPNEPDADNAVVGSFG